MQVIVLFGSNSAQKQKMIEEAIRRLSSKGEVRLASSLYETEPWGFECEENFLNQVVVFETILTPHAFLAYCLETERQLGRIRHSNGPRYTSRPIDIDILFYDNLILDTPDLIVPHPRMCERNFVLTPLAEILPHLVHPVYQKTIEELLAECTDALKAEKIDKG